MMLAAKVYVCLTFLLPFYARRRAKILYINSSSSSKQASKQASEQRQLFDSIA